MEAVSEKKGFTACQIYHISVKPELQFQRRIGSACISEPKGCKVTESFEHPSDFEYQAFNHLKKGLFGKG